MLTKQSSLKQTFLIILLFSFSFGHAQIWKKIQKKAEKAVERKIEKKVEDETERAMDSILNPNEKREPTDSHTNPDHSEKKIPTQAQEKTGFTKIEVYRKFDFVPGNNIIFFDDFSKDFVGDFPSKWNTNGSGELVQLNTSKGNWFELKPGYNIQYLPLITNSLPEEYTIEFDLLAEGLDHKTSSTARLYITLDDNSSFKTGKNNATISIPFGQYCAFGIGIKNRINNNHVISSTITADIRKAVKNSPHISIAVNKERFRLWINQTKYVDIPQLIPTPNFISNVKFNIYGFKDGKDRLFVKNIKIAEGGLDLRKDLLNNGSVSTNGILFDTGKASIKPQSFGIIRQISQVLQQDEKLKLVIIGHTDSDGSEDANLTLSKRRAESVKQALINIYNISEDKLTIDGKGESEPIADNKSINGKAQNRRVEFILR
ncbi:OmpA family protein [Pseudofulvibacter geojedonensis]|uniref:OmpA family protein n=1 Tax=Pseudofulvibacter geojedonensis TaxID=1123758 RepID=A0ABW3I4N7_9FLAO